jgi:hypothetical protein
VVASALQVQGHSLSTSLRHMAIEHSYSASLCPLFKEQSVHSYELLYEQGVFNLLGPYRYKEHHQFSASAVELEFLRSERRLRSGKHFA